MKQVRELCMEQLRNMTDEEITRAITNDTTTPSLPQSKDSNLSKNQATSDEEVLDSGDSGAGRGEVVVEGKESCGLVSEDPRRTPMEAEEEGEIVINVSDVTESSAESDDSEDNPDKTTRHQALGTESAEDIDLAPATKPEEVSEQKDPVGAVTCEDDASISEDTNATESSHADEDAKVATASKEEDLAKNENEEASHRFSYEPDQHTLAASQFLEMELRRRALEAELRRSNDGKQSEGKAPRARRNSVHRSESLTSGPLEEKEKREQRETEDSGDSCAHEDTDGAEKNGEGDLAIQGLKEDEVATENSNMNALQVRELLEERLRQRALQAMLRKKKSTAAT